MIVGVVYPDFAGPDLVDRAVRARSAAARRSSAS